MAVAVVTAPADSLHWNHARSSVHRPSSSSVVVAHGPWRHVSHADHRLSSRRHETHDAGEWMGWRSCAGVSVQPLRPLVFVVVLLLLLLLLSVVVVYFRGRSYGKDGRGCVVVVEERQLLQL